MNADRESLWKESAKPIGNFSGNLLVLRTFLDIKLASIFYSLRPWLKSFQGKVLEVGCGNQPYRFLIQNAFYQGIDHVLAREFASPRSDIRYYDQTTFPESADEYDWCFHTEVLEHISDPESFFRECHRVLKPSGQLLFTVPFSYRYHYIPNDYFRYTPSGLKTLLEKTGFQILEIQSQGTDITVASYKVISVFFRFLTEKTFLPRRFFRVALTLLCLPFLLLIHLLGMSSLAWQWGSPNDTLGYLVIAKKTDPAKTAGPGPA